MNELIEIYKLDMSALSKQQLATLIAQQVDFCNDDDIDPTPYENIFDKSLIGHDCVPNYRDTEINEWPEASHGIEPLTSPWYEYLLKECTGYGDIRVKLCVVEDYLVCWDDFHHVMSKEQIEKIRDKLNTQSFQHYRARTFINALKHQDKYLIKKFIRKHFIDEFLEYIDNDQIYDIVTYSLIIPNETVYLSFNEPSSYNFFDNIFGCNEDIFNKLYHDMVTNKEIGKLQIIYDNHHDKLNFKSTCKSFSDYELDFYPYSPTI
jgi:hypothetical protein